jgi:hypothetical protein
MLERLGIVLKCLLICVGLIMVAIAILTAINLIPVILHLLAPSLCFGGIGAVIGFTIDYIFGTEPIFTCIFGLAGVLAGAVMMIRTLTGKDETYYR